MSDTAITLVANLAQDCLVRHMDVHQYYFRISMGSDFERVKTYGSSRIGLSDKPWDRLSMYREGELPVYPVRHDQMIIASFWDDLVADAALTFGTLDHKLTIYERPFFTAYHQDGLEYIGKEDGLDERNQGTHFFFRWPADRALAVLWTIEQDFTVRMTYLNERTL